MGCVWDTLGALWVGQGASSSKYAPLILRSLVRPGITPLKPKSLKVGFVVAVLHADLHKQPVCVPVRNRHGHKSITVACRHPACDRLCYILQEAARWVTAKWLWAYQCPLIALTWSLVTPGPCLSCASAQPWCWSWPFTSQLNFGSFLVSSGCCGGLDSWPPSPGWCRCCWSPLTVLAAPFGNLNPNPHRPRAPIRRG